MFFRAYKVGPKVLVVLLAVFTVCTALGWHCAAQVAGPTTPSAASPSLDVRLPLKSNSIRFAVIGDSGTGDRKQYDVAQEMELYRRTVGFEFVIMLGDNIYGGNRPKDFSEKFEKPFQPLLDAGIKFYAALGNHDDPNQERLYKPFNMGGERYYTFKKGPVEFFVLDSNYMDPAQLQWLQQKLQKSDAKWKISYFHHPLYNVGKSHGPDVDLRSQLEPIFKQYGVNAVFSGHEHVYERVKPVGDIYYFVQGSSAKLSGHDLPQSDNVQLGYDSDRAFMLIEIAGDDLYFQTISRMGKTIDSGSLPRQQPKSPGSKP